MSVIKLASSREHVATRACNTCPHAPAGEIVIYSRCQATGQYIDVERPASPAPAVSAEDFESSARRMFPGGPRRYSSDRDLPLTPLRRSLASSDAEAARAWSFRPPLR
jgi:hypothetical protein